MEQETETVAIVGKKGMDESWDEEDIAWRRIQQHQQTCRIRRACVVGGLIVYAFLILQWRMRKTQAESL
jgi:hypothetical protein